MIVANSSYQEVTDGQYPAIYPALYVVLSDPSQPDPWLWFHMFPIASCQDCDCGSAQIGHSLPHGSPTDVSSYANANTEDGLMFERSRYILACIQCVT